VKTLAVSIGIDVSCVTILTNSILTRTECKQNLYIIYLIVKKRREIGGSILTLIHS
jgi:hypothetical protein